MYVENDGVSVSGDEIEVNVAVRGEAEVEVDENETITLSLDDILSNVDDEKLLDRMDHDTIREYAKEHEIKLESDDKEFSREGFEKWLTESDSNVVYAMRLINQRIAG